MSVYDNGQGSVDSTGWDQPVTSTKNGEHHPPPNPRVQTERGMERAPTPDPYTDDNPHVRRHFSNRPT